MADTKPSGHLVFTATDLAHLRDRMALRIKNAGDDMDRATRVLAHLVRIGFIGMSSVSLPPYHQADPVAPRTGEPNAEHPTMVCRNTD